MVFLSAGTATRALGQDEFRRDRIGTDVADGALAGECPPIGSDITRWIRCIALAKYPSPHLYPHQRRASDLKYALFLILGSPHSHRSVRASRAEILSRPTR